MTGFGTKEIADDLVAELVDIAAEDITPGEPVVRICVIPFRKPAGQEIPNSAKGRQFWKIKEAIGAWAELYRQRSGMRPPRQETPEP